ncbi:uncharacterized protein TM35_000361330 [Trypanosoma theileri]|uniref:Uncharacterized protein n=1 Tax=Trypanosoma theileri TaxID=67003 RepID=A0A1X0NLE5_9TRYP|nr:uncharacterized protein TM35_000361330 [Trypanosoma theileri]ORC85273.1 hypothetical protein TM35_000361330 [Trypanosoma theileri]
MTSDRSRDGANSVDGNSGGTKGVKSASGPDFSSSSSSSSSSETTSTKVTDVRGKTAAAVVGVDKPITTAGSSAAARRLALFGSRALAAGSKGRCSSLPPPSSSSSSIHGETTAELGAAGNSNALASSSHSPTSSSSSVGSFAGEEGSGGLTSFGAPRGDVASYIRHEDAISSPGKYLVIGDGMMAPFMALCLRVHGLDCDLAYHQSDDDLDRGTIVLTPSLTQILGDVLNVSVPSGSVVGRLLTFDHVGNDMCDLDLNEFRAKGESPTFFCCDRPKLERALLSLCSVGPHACPRLPPPRLDRGGLEPLDRGGVRVHFAGGAGRRDYLGVITTARKPALVPELTLTDEELRRRAANDETYTEARMKAVRWAEVCVPPLPELGKLEKRFTPGSQEIVELLTPRGAKMTVRPTMMATKLFYNVTITIPDATPDPRLKTSSTKQFWDDVIEHWTAGVPGYIPHTMFRPMMTHMQQHFTKSSALVYRTPLFVMPHWSEGGGRVIKIAHAAHGAAFDAIDVGDAQGFTDCFGLARTLASGGGELDVQNYLRERRLQVMEELDHHTQLLHYGVKERGQLAYMSSRFAMKIMRRYKKSWRSILQNHVTLMPKIVK